MSTSCSRCGIQEAVYYKSRKGGEPSKHRWCADCRRDYMREWLYGLTPEAWQELSKDGCQVPGCASFEMLSVDHDHKCCPHKRATGGSGKTCGKCVRGVICRGCNLALGNIGDSIPRLQGLLAYLLEQEQQK